MATSSIFADFTIRDKKTARAFVKAMEVSEKTPPQKRTVDFQFVESPEEIKKVADGIRKNRNGKRAWRMAFRIVNLLDLLQKASLDDVHDFLCTFSCPLNTEIEDFIKNKSIDCSRQKISESPLHLKKNNLRIH